VRERGGVYRARLSSIRRIYGSSRRIVDMFTQTTIMPTYTHRQVVRRRHEHQNKGVTKSRDSIGIMKSKLVSDIFCT
jgi:hypothetical protein